MFLLISMTLIQIEIKKQNIITRISMKCIVIMATNLILAILAYLLNINVNNDIVEIKNNLDIKNEENLPEKVEDIGGDTS